MFHPVVPVHGDSNEDQAHKSPFGRKELQEHQEAIEMRYCQEAVLG
jgi:hypothetical protein